MSPSILSARTDLTSRVKLRPVCGGAICRYRCGRGALLPSGSIRWMCYFVSVIFARAGHAILHQHRCHLQKSLNLPGDNSVYRTVGWMLRWPR